MWQQDIPRERHVGKSRCQSVRVFSRTVPDVLAGFGLKPTEEALTEYSAERASEILAALLWKDLAYGCEIMPLTRAQELADDFVHSHPHGTRFFANADWAAYLRERPKAFTFWNLTPSTFDGGLLALGRDIASCVWVEDED